MGPKHIKHIYVPATGVIGGLIWIAGGMLLAFWMDRQWPWRYAVAFTALIVANFAAFFAVLRLWPDWRGLLATLPFLALNYRIAFVIGERTTLRPRC